MNRHNHKKWLASDKQSDQDDGHWVSTVCRSFGFTTKTDSEIAFIAGQGDFDVMMTTVRDVKSQMIFFMSNDGTSHARFEGI